MTYVNIRNIRIPNCWASCGSLMNGNDHRVRQRSEQSSRVNTIGLDWVNVDRYWNCY